MARSFSLALNTWPCCQCSGDVGCQTCADDAARCGRRKPWAQPCLRRRRPDDVALGEGRRPAPQVDPVGGVKRELAVHGVEPQDATRERCARGGACRRDGAPAGPADDEIGDRDHDQRDADWPGERGQAEKRSRYRRLPGVHPAPRVTREASTARHGGDGEECEQRVGKEQSVPAESGTRRRERGPLRASRPSQGARIACAAAHSPPRRWPARADAAAM